MLSQVQYINQSNSIKDWSLGEYIGIPFEKHLYRVLSRYMEKYNGKVLVYDTPASRDDGKDIIIESTTDIHNLMGHDFYLREKSKIKIYIECKTSTNDKISWNQLAGNVARIENDDIQYYVVATNTTLVPYTFYQFAKETKKRDIEFLLVDQSLLAPYLVEEGALIGEIELTDLINNKQQGICSEYQVLRYEKNMRTCFEIYLLIRNYNFEADKIQIVLGTDHNWTLSPDKIDILLGKNQFRCIKLVAERNYSGGIDQLNIIFHSNYSNRVIEVKGINMDFDFVPSLHGKQHYEVLDELFDLITTSTTFQTRFLIGESGCGKSRIIDELYTKVSGRNVSMFLIKCTRNEANVKSDLIKLLTEKEMLHEVQNNTSLESIIKQINTEFHRCVLIFDDIHNLNVLLDEMKKVILMNVNKAITIILLGRNDYSAGTLDYYSFLQWCESNDDIKGKEITNLTEPDATNLIRSVINDVPLIVLQDLLSKSNRNPLFIVQFIEYLLEMNLAHVINRSTVGILNTDTFATKKYIPDAIEKIYKNRCSILAKESDGVHMLNFLRLVSFIGVTFPKEIPLLYFHENSQLIDILIKRKFLSFTEDGELCFFHETLFLYFRHELMSCARTYKHIWKEILNFEEYLNQLDSGVAHFYNNNYKLSAEKLAPVWDACNSMNNYSAVNINREYYEYLDIVYQLAKREKNAELQKKIILYKVYTALHYYAPMIAVNECAYATKLINSNKKLSEDNMFLYSITELKAHGYMNAGQLKNSERYLTECLTMSLLYPKKFEAVSKFDMYDRLAGLYIKYNHFMLAENYNKLSETIAAEIKDKDLMSLALITKAKLNLYINPKEAEKLLLEARELLKEKSYERTFFHNELSIIIQQLPLHKDDIDWIDQAETLTDNYRQLSIQNSFSSSVIRSYLILAVLEFHSNSGTNRFEKAEMFISHGIDASIKYGIGTYIWEFYNLKLIISTRLHKNEEYIMKIVKTIERMLKQQNLFYLGNLDFCYANILVLTNIGKYYTKETDFYKFMNSISCNEGLYNSSCNFNCEDPRCQYVCERAVNQFKSQLKHVRQNHLLLMDKSVTYSLFDEKTGYYIALS